MTTKGFFDCDGQELISARSRFSKFARQLATVPPFQEAFFLGHRYARNAPTSCHAASSSTMPLSTSASSAPSAASLHRPQAGGGVRQFHLGLAQLLPVPAIRPRP